MHKAFLLLLLLGVGVAARPVFLQTKSTAEARQSSPATPVRPPFPETPHAFARYVNGLEANTAFSTIGNETGPIVDPQARITGDSAVRVHYLRDGLYFVRSPLIKPTSFLRNHRTANAVAMLEEYGPKYKGHYIVERTDYNTLRYFKGGGRAPKLSDKDKATIRAKGAFLILDDEGRKVYDAYKATLRNDS